MPANGDPDPEQGIAAIRNLDHTVLFCLRMAVTRLFYRDIMRLPIETDRANWVSFRIGAALLSLRPRDTANDRHADTGPCVQLAFRVPPAAIDTCHAELLAAGVPIHRGPVDLPAWRHRAVFFHDPENNLIEIYTEL